MSEAQGVASGESQIQPLIASLVVRLESNGALAAAADLLGRVRELVDPSGDPAVTAMLVATDQIAARWHCEAHRLEICRRAQNQALESEAEARHSLITALHAVAELIPGTRGRRGSSPPDRSESKPAGSPSPPDLLGEAENARLAAFLLGFCAIQTHGHTIEGLRGARAARVMRYLMFRCGQPAHRDLLIETFWPDCDSETGRRNLHQTMYVIRRVLRVRTGLDHFTYKNEAYSVDRNAGFWCDVEEFEARATAGRRAQRQGRVDEAAREFELAVALYAGDLLEDMPHENWVLTERDRLRLAYLECANHLAELRLSRGAVDAALEISQQILRRDPCDETTHRRVMSCYSLTGRRPLAIHQYRTCSSNLAETLDLEPSKETTDLYCSLVNG